jgi:hypothetical protein
MKKTLMAAAVILAGTGFALPSKASAAAFTPGVTGAAFGDANSLKVDVRSRRDRRSYRGWHENHHAYRSWDRRPHYGTIIGGIALGALLAGSAYAYAERPPGPGLCWYWADRYQRQGFWDYC